LRASEPAEVVVIPALIKDRLLIQRLKARGTVAARPSRGTPRSRVAPC